MMEKYTPLMRERKAKKPKMKASRPGAATARNSAQAKCSVPTQYQGKCVHCMNCMKSGRLPLAAFIARLRYMPMA